MPHAPGNTVQKERQVPEMRHDPGPRQQQATGKKVGWTAAGENVHAWPKPQLDT